MKIDPRTVLSHAMSPTAPEDRKAKDLVELRKSCQEFESILVQEMYKSMRKAVPESELFAHSMATDLYQEMFDAEIARKTADGKGIGIAEAMYRQLEDMVANKVYDK